MNKRHTACEEEIRRQKFVGESCGDLMTIRQFKEYCLNRDFLDYDGSGRISNGKVYFPDECIYPSDITEKKINLDQDVTHVMWFNK